ncbi:MAG: ExbD/TolR family protein [Burkholderiaceae bacterium]
MAFGGLSPSSQQQPMAEINTTPLVDVMLVLLVIFIITAPLLTHGIRLDLPRAGAPPSAQPPQTVTLSIDAAGAVFWNDEPVADADALQLRLRQAAAQQPPAPLQLRADRDTRYQRIAELMAAAQAAGIAQIGFITEPVRAAPKAAELTR